MLEARDNERFDVTVLLREDFVWCAALLLILTTAPSLAQTDLRVNLTREVLEASGARASLQHLPALARSMAQTHPRLQGLAPDEREKVADKMVAAVEPDAMYRSMVEETLKRFHEERFREFLAAYRTPLAERLVELHLKVLEPQLWQAKEAYVKTVTLTQMEQPRAVLLAELDEATASSAAEAELGLKMLSGFVVQRKGETDEAFAVRYEQLRQKAYANARAKFIAEHLFVYESVSDADLERFVRLHQSEAVSYTSRVIVVATLVATAESLDRLMSALGE